MFCVMADDSGNVCCSNDTDSKMCVVVMTRADSKRIRALTIVDTPVWTTRDG